MATDVTMEHGNARRRTRRSGARATGASPVDTGAAFRAAQRHSRRVRILRAGLPALALACIGVFSWFTFLSTPPNIRLNVASTGIQDGKLVMTNPKLSGFTGNNLPYSMTAARAVQDIKNTRVFTLQDIDAQLPLSASQKANVQAGTGVYDSTKDSLKLGAGVTFRTSDGAVARLKSADVDMAAGKLQTSEPVDIRNGDTKLTADSMSMSKRDGVVVFKNRVKLVIKPTALQKTDTAKAAD
jgi:lipopolysaccharide export system protein LptC